MEKISRGEVAFHLITNLIVVATIAFMSYEIFMGAMNAIK